MAAAVAAPAVEAAPAPNTRPTRPDEKIFKEELAKAEKEHKASMDKFVCAARLLFLFFLAVHILAVDFRAAALPLSSSIRESAILCHHAAYFPSYYEARDWCKRRSQNKKSAAERWWKKKIRAEIMLSSRQIGHVLTAA